MRVLLIDDDAEIAEMLARIVRWLGHQAVTCSDPMQAIDEHSIGPAFDVVFADYMMHPDGVEVLATFENTNSYRVLLTASYATKEISAALTAGVIHQVLTKPATIVDLKTCFVLAAAR